MMLRMNCSTIMVVLHFWCSNDAAHGAASLCCLSSTIDAIHALHELLRILRCAAIVAALLVQQSEDGEDGSYAYCAMTRVNEAREMTRLINDAHPKARSMF
jgi:hypothetical protein